MNTFVQNIMPYFTRFKRNLYANWYLCLDPCPYKMGILSNYRISTFTYTKSNVDCWKLESKRACIYTSAFRPREQEEESIDSEIVAIPTPKTFVEEESSEQFRNSLFASSTDSVTLQLKSCVSIDQVFNILNNNLQSLTLEQYCQSLLVLWDLVHASNLFSCLINQKEAFPFYHSLKTSNVGVELRPIVDRMMSNLHLISSVRNISADCLVSCLLYSTRLGIGFRNPLIHELLGGVNILLDSEDENAFPISAISRLTLSLYDIDEIWAKLMLVKTLPFIYKHFGEYKIK